MGNNAIINNDIDVAGAPKLRHIPAAVLTN
jgi:hypothetical protein